MNKSVLFGDRGLVICHRAEAGQPITMLCRVQHKGPCVGSAQACTSSHSCTRWSGPFLPWWMARPRERFTSPHLPVHMRDMWPVTRPATPVLKSPPSSAFRCRNAPEVTGFRRLHSGPVTPGMRGPIRIRLTYPPPHTLIYLCPDLITSANKNTACFLFFNPSHREERQAVKECTKAWDSSTSKCPLTANEQRSSPTMSHVHLAFKAYKVQGEPHSMSLTLEGQV